MRGIALCWIALAAGCAFDGAEGEIPLDPGGTPAPQIPKGNSRITGTVTVSEPRGIFGAVLFPANSAPLTSLNPCFPDKTTSSDVVGSSRRFEFPEIAPGNYLVIVFRADAVSPRAFERTTKLVSVSGTDTDTGPISLPSPIVATARESGDQDMVAWTAPPSLAAVTGFAYRLSDRDDACDPGDEMQVAPVTNGYEIPESDQRVRIGLDWPTAGQMAIKVILEDDGRGGRPGR